MVQLVFLLCQDNTLTGPLPDQWGIGALPALRELNLSSNQVFLLCPCNAAVLKLKGAHDEHVGSWLLRCTAGRHCASLGHWQRHGSNDPSGSGSQSALRHSACKPQQVRACRIAVLVATCNADHA